MDIKTREVDDVVVFDLEGDLVRSEIPGPTLLQFVKAQLERGKNKILLNLEKTKFMDSFGVGEIVASYAAVWDLGGKLNLACLPRKIHTFFNVCVIAPPWHLRPEGGGVYDTVEAALESFKKD